MSFWIVAATEMEVDLLKREVKAKPAGSVGRNTFYFGLFGRKPVYLGIVGVGVVSAGISLGGFVSVLGAREIVMVGSAGALPESGLEIGDLAAASSEILAELGVCTGPGTGDTSRLGLVTMQQEISLDSQMTREVAEEAQACARVVAGPCLTVVGSSADSEQGHCRALRFRALAENMEGYALALAGEALCVQVAEIRGIANQAGERDKSLWNLDLANERAQRGVLQYMRRKF
jgi:futalosine hydrolase